MISRQEIERLAALKSERGILSAYICLDPRLRFVRQQATLQFKGALKRAERELTDGAWREALEREGAAVLKYLANAEPPGRGLVIFSCQPDGLWEALQLDVPVPSMVGIDTTTKIGVLAESLSEFPRFIVAVVQRDKATVYIAEQGTAERRLRMGADVPGQHDTGGRSQMRFERHIEVHVLKYLQALAVELKRLAEERPCKLAIGGSEEMADALLQMLPEPIARSFIGRFPVDHKHDTERMLLERAEELWSEHERREADRLLDQIVDAAKSKKRGVLGVEPTLGALMEEKVRALVVADGLAIEGSVCTRCDYFSSRDFESCPVCGAKAEHKNVTDRAVEKALLIGASTDIVAERRSRDRLLAEGGVGALLWY